MSNLYVPNSFDPNRVGELYLPNNAEAFKEGVNLRLPSASQDTLKVLLILVDMQIDFVFANGALSVPGGIKDVIRIINWILSHTVSGELTRIAASLDSHIPYQIFFPSWWTNAQGENPEPYTVITSADLLAGKWFPRVSGAINGVDLHEISANYIEKLEAKSKKNLMIWPYHTMIGQPGQALVPTLSEAISFHAGARGAQPSYLAKGEISETEYYSILEPEVPVPHHPRGGLNKDFLDMMAGYDLVYIAGEAKSHCVLETITSIMRYFGPNSEVARKLRFLMDATSSVVHPVIDFEAMCQPLYEQFARDGAQLVLTTDPIR